MGRVTKRPLALADLAEIWSFIADDSEAHADHFMDQADGIDIVRVLHSARDITAEAFTT